MKKLFIFKSFVILSIVTLSWSNVITNITKNYKKYIFNDFDIASDAIDGIQKTLILEKEGIPYFIRRTYNIGENEISVTTKTHFKKYRKKPSYNKEIINVSTINNSGAIIEFIYKSSNKNQITCINKKTKNDVSKRQKIDFQSL